MDFTEKYTSDKDEKMLLRRINDLVKSSEKHFSVVYSGFLDPAQQALVSRVTEFYGFIEAIGGYDDAERRLLRICTNEYSNDDGAPIVLFTAEATMKDAEISHRDVLGALMGLGIKREMTGDILPNGSRPQFFCHASVADFIELELKKIGRYNVELRRSECAELYETRYKDMTVNISSMRLDCISAEAFGISRTKAAEYIKKGLVFVNWQPKEDPSLEIRSGDRISMRGKGKIEVTGVSGTSRKGRLFVEIRKKL